MHVKKALMLSAVLLGTLLTFYMFSNLKSPSVIVFADGSPSIESCNSAGITVNEFNAGAAVYVKGSGLEAGGVYYVYIAKDYSSWKNSTTHKSDLYIIEGPITVDVDAQGNIENQPVLIWASSSVGDYDIWADSQTNGEIGFYDEYDAIDNLDVNDAGFIVVSEMLLITLPILFVCLTIISLKRRIIAVNGKHNNTKK